MRTDGKRWNDKMKLALHELERKIQRDTMEGRSEGWPRPEQVEAWTAERQRQRNCGQYCGDSARADGQTKEGLRRKNFTQTVLMQVAKSAAFALATIALLQGVGRMLPDSVTVSNTVNGRELPIYCVQTDEKKVALSFDAAWENSRLRNGILIVHIEYYVCLLADELTSANHFFI